MSVENPNTVKVDDAEVLSQEPSKEEEHWQEFWIWRVQAPIVGEIFRMAEKEREGVFPVFASWFREEVINGNVLDDVLLDLSERVAPGFGPQNRKSFGEKEKRAAVVGIEKSSFPGKDDLIDKFISNVIERFCSLHSEKEGDEGAKGIASAFSALRVLGARLGKSREKPLGGVSRDDSSGVELKRAA